MKIRVTIQGEGYAGAEIDCTKEQYDFLEKVNEELMADYSPYCPTLDIAVLKE